ncbi:MAG: hypothetical protein A2593_00180 [Candidatus Moranbacteria bacterium RIFOXYD1_FULL_44_9]|nr:MAG: hypothetical protein A2593_00180 [Candidatus Moranbacteria bacterium RIFOXYD1_FULL_44_9]
MKSRTAQILGNEPFKKWTQFCGNNTLGTRIPQNFGYSLFLNSAGFSPQILPAERGLGNE